MTCRQVSSELKPLTYNRSATVRSEVGCNTTVYEELKSKLGEIQSYKSNSLKFWVENAEWLVLADDSIKEINKAKLNANLHKIGIEPNPEKLDEIYDALRTLAKEKAELGKEAWADKKITKTALVEFIKSTNEPFPDKSKSERLEGKILATGLDDTYVLTAKAQQMDYLKNKRESRYFTSDETGKIDSAILSRLHGLRSSLDSGELSDSPIAFYNRCLREIKEAGKSVGLSDSNSDLANAYFEGCMHEVTSRCLHRYKKITA